MSKENVQPSLIFRPVKQWYDADVIHYPATYPCPECGTQERFTFTRATGRKTCDACGAFVDTMPASEVMRRHAQDIIAGKESGEGFARALEDDVERQDLTTEYICHLIGVTGGDMTVDDSGMIDDIDPLYIWLVLRATPVQRARAYLETVDDA